MLVKSQVNLQFCYNNMERPMLCSIIVFVHVTSYVMSSEPFTEVCEEGSGPHDCSSNTHCCEQSKCDFISEKMLLPCCNEEETKRHPPPDYCVRCSRCCSYEEMKQEPFPQECSACPTCTIGNDQNM